MKFTTYNVRHVWITYIFVARTTNTVVGWSYFCKCKFTLMYFACCYFIANSITDLHIFQWQDNHLIFWCKFKWEMPNGHSSVDRTSAWSHTMSSSMIGPGFETNQCLFSGMWKRMAWLPCWAPRGQQVSHQSANKAGHYGFETQRTPHQKSKTGVSLVAQKDLCPPFF